MHATLLPPPRRALKIVNECCLGTSGGVGIWKADLLGGVISKLAILRHFIFFTIPYKNGRVGDLCLVHGRLGMGGALIGVILQFLLNPDARGWYVDRASANATFSRRKMQN